VTLTKIKKIGVLLCMLFISRIVIAQTSSSLSKEFDLAGERSIEAQYYIMESKLVNYSLDGTRTGNDVFRLYLKYEPSEQGEEYICTKFTVQLDDAPEVTVPVLDNWSYVYYPDIDEQGQVFGIDHSRFDNLKDENGNPIPPDKSYHVYNAFIDFHSFCNVFAQPTTEGRGIQDLTKIGQKIVHAAAFSEPPTNLGENIEDGSFFKNGEITLEFRGLGIVNDKTCAIIGYDSGESNYKMISKPMPNFEVITTGTSHYFGDIYKDLATNWVQKVTLAEFVVSETTLPMPPNTINSINEREIIIKNVNEEEFNPQ